MKLVIEIPEEVYKYIMKLQLRNMAEEYIAEGTPLPKGHGRLIDADKLFMECQTINGYMCIDEVVNAPTIIEMDDT